MKFKAKDGIVYCKDESYQKEFDCRSNNFYNQEYNEDSDKRSYWNGYLVHREDGPAIEWSDSGKHWYIDGKRHREGGPAVEYSFGNKEWWLNGINYSEKEYWKTINLFKNKKKVLDEI